MIVLASHNRIDLLENLLIQLHQINLNGHNILVVDTNSKDNVYLKGIVDIKERYPNVIFDRKEYDCYDSGAFIHAYKKYKSNSFIFLQDSIKITNPNIMVEWDIALSENGVVPMYNFDFFYDNEEQRIWVTDMIGCESQPTDGIFGPIFGVNKEILDLIPIGWLKEPNNKLYACAMERRWSLIFHVLNIKKQYMVYLNSNEQQDFLTGNTMKYAKHLNKSFLRTVR